jgi:hypothetical protein
MELFHAVTMEQGQKLLKRMLFLAYNASKVIGLGILQARPHMSETELAEAYFSDGRRLSADYAFGRMMKMYANLVSVVDGVSAQTNVSTPRLDYQSWCSIYPTWEALVEAAKVSLEKEQRSDAILDTIDPDEWDDGTLT